ncbi:Serine/threonine protein kinase [Pseudarcicella hirudinis]|uniref:Serine/threonine protein kinase n=1 Tax=Pseudarcicella hirudinis TaxID=1079859 RepID=A0A1I5M8L7_9BACT|nr:serine/threonine-protein kinase [Pseudarcicella hirudinis]SFP05667.1 Serine/threonine protein kinase [Pseudarcicella hirudinis]
MAKIKLKGLLNTYLFDPKDESSVLSPGGMGIPYKGIEAETGRTVVIKVLFRDLTENVSNVERVKRASEIKIKHNNLIEMLDFIEKDSIYHDISVFVEGTDLSKIIDHRKKQGKVFSYEESKEIVNDILDGLEVLHKNKIIHRDIDPSNIRICEDGSAKLMDFGVVRITGGKTKSLTGMGTLIGKPNYSPPEQIRGESDNINETTDLYALGITIYEMLTGKVPFERGNEYDTMQAQVNEALPFNNILSDALFDFLVKATAKQQHKRFQNVSAFRNAFNNPVERAWWQKKQMQILVASGIIATLGGSGLFFRHQHNTSIGKTNIEKANKFLSIAKYDSSKVYFQKAVEYIDDGSVKQKIEMLNALIPAMSDFYNARYKNAFDKLKEASGLDSGDADYYLGELTYNGLGTVKDYRKGWEYTNSAVKKGFGMANWRIALALENGLGIKKDKNKADQHYLESVEAIKKLAEAGDPEALGNLGGMYTSGKGLSKNEKLGFENYLAAANKGYAFVQENLADMYRYGIGTPVNLPEAVKWYTTSASKGHPAAQLTLGRMYLYGEGVYQDASKGLDFIRKASDQNYSAALSDLGYQYFTGKFVPADYRKSADYYLKAVTYDNDNIPALESLAYFCKTGLGVDKNYKEAEKYYLKAIRQDSSRANQDYFNIAKLYFEGGFGLRKDEFMFIHYCELADNAGNTVARESLGIYYNQQGTEAYRSALFNTAREYFNKAVLKGNAIASRNLKYMDQKGK